MHQRNVIRNAVVAALQAASIVSTVYPTRFLPYQIAKLPALAVYTVSETVQPESLNRTRGASRELWRNLSLVIEGAVRASGTGDNADDALDALALAVEVAMHADDSLGGVCDWSLLESTEIFMQETGEKDIGVIRMTYNILYQTLAPDDANVTLPNLQSVDIKYGPNGQTLPSTDNAEDKITGLDTAPAPTLPYTQDPKEYD